MFDSYTLNETVTANVHTHNTHTDGGYIDTTSTASTTINVSGQGTTANYSGTQTLDTSSDNVGPGYNIPTENDQTNPVSGTADISSLIAKPSGWNWYAGASNATDYTFNGGASENVTLSETATLQSNGTIKPTLVVNSFNSYYKGAASGQVQDDEPETPASPGGTDTFARNETYGGSDTVTGSGSYGGGNTNATFRAVQVGTFNVADTETDNNETVTGTDASGNPYTMNYNYGGQVSGSGSFTATHNYQDVGNGLALTSESFQGSATGQNSYQDSGTLNGQAFDDSSSVPESISDPEETYPGSSTPVTNPDGLVNAFPFQDTVTPNGAVYGAAGNGGVFLLVNPVLQIGAVKLYNQIAKYAESRAKKAALVTLAKNEIMQQLQATGMASGTFTDSNGNTWAQAAGDAKELTEAQKGGARIVGAQGPFGLDNVKVDKTVVSITYAVDGGGLAPRSGNVALKYKYITTYTGTNKQGQQVSKDLTVLGGKAILFEDARIQNMDLKEP